jgi:hypothetical protein
MNISNFSDIETAHTNFDCAMQRAENLSILGAKNVLELCVGPSLKDLQIAYKRFSIDVCGNDIDKRWEAFYKPGKWLIGNALNIDYNQFDAVVFAPPLSRGCSGKREDSLMVDEVFPKYQSFLDKLNKDNYKKTYVLVLPARSLATSDDRRQLHSLMSKITSSNKEIVSMCAGSRKIRKYVDVYCW